MAIVRPFAYNTGTTLSGTVQYGTLSVGVDPNNRYNQNYGGIKWWNIRCSDNNNTIKD